VKHFALSLLVLAIGVSDSHGQERTADTAPAVAPMLADNMSTMQMRHLKLGYAGKAGNWPLARYEMNAMKQSFDGATRLFQTVGSQSFTDLVAKNTTPALEEIQRAIDKQNPATFSAAFEKLTDACNGCHQASKFGFIVMRVPIASPFSNQVFTPQPK
jgi:hypothetical protein